MKKKTGRIDNHYNSRFADCMYQYSAVKNIHDVDQCKVESLTGNDLSYFRFLNDEFFARIESMLSRKQDQISR